MIARFQIENFQFERDNVSLGGRLSSGQDNDLRISRGCLEYPAISHKCNPSGRADQFERDKQFLVLAICGCLKECKRLTIGSIRQASFSIIGQQLKRVKYEN